MQGYEVQQSSASYPLLFLMISSTDHISPATGLSPTVTISKNGGAFASPSGAVTEIANGWYKVAGNATDTGTLGPLALHATASGADPTDMLFPVIAVNPQSTAFGLSLAKTTNITGFNDIAATAIVSSGAINTSGGAVSTVTTVTNQLTAAQIATGVFQDTTAGDFTVANSIGKSLYTSGNAPGAASGLALVGSAMGAVASVTGPVAVSLTQTLNAARALDAIADTSYTLNDAMQAAVASVAAQVDASSGTSCIWKTASTGTTLRTKTLTTTPTPTTVVDKAV